MWWITQWQVCPIPHENIIDGDIVVFHEHYEVQKLLFGPKFDGLPNSINASPNMTHNKFTSFMGSF
jgi:hypothetical protein